MNVDDLISRATHTTGRTLLGVSAAVVLSEKYNHGLEKFPILTTANAMPADMIIFAAEGFLVFLTCFHLLNWYNDRGSYYSGELIKVYDEQKSLNTSNRVMESDENQQPMGYVELLSHYKGLISTTSKIQFFSLYFQHLCIPVSAGVYAFYKLLQNSS